jgi:SPP1 family predicted phage head-tail adaptor
VLSRPGESTAGRLRHRLVLERPVATADGAGGATIAWEEVATLSAEIVPASSVERNVGEGLADLTQHKVVIRKRDDVSAGDRFRLGARLFRITGVTDPEEDGRYLVCLAEEEGAA